MQKTFRVLNTQDLRDINDEAVKRGYNRSLTDRFFTDVDPDGHHVVSVDALHEHAGGVRVEPHRRWSVMDKMRNNGSPVNVQVDVAPGMENRGDLLTRDIPA